MEYKGFIQWANEKQDAFYYHDGHCVYKAPTSNVSDLEGWMQGRFEATVSNWNIYAESLGRTKIKL